MQRDVLLLVNTDGAIQLNRHDAVNTAGINVQVQTENKAVVWLGYDLHVC